MSARYETYIDRTGDEIAGTRSEHETLQAAADEYIRLRERAKDWTWCNAVLYAPGGLDIDCADGLTDEEREWFEEYIEGNIIKETP